MIVEEGDGELYRRMKELNKAIVKAVRAGWKQYNVKPSPVEIANFKTALYQNIQWLDEARNDFPRIINILEVPSENFNHHFRLAHLRFYQEVWNWEKRWFGSSGGVEGSEK